MKKADNSIETKDFTFSRVVTQLPEEVFKAINNVTAWWSEDFKGSSQKLDDEFEVHFEDIHHSTQKLVDVIPNKKVVWLVTESRLNFISDKSEWTGTRIIFELSAEGTGTKIHFTHLGLVPKIECFGDCSNGWMYSLDQSLLPLIRTGKGQPNKISIHK